MQSKKTISKISGLSTVKFNELGFPLTKTIPNNDQKISGSSLSVKKKTVSVLSMMAVSNGTSLSFPWNLLSCHFNSFKENKK